MILSQKKNHNMHDATKRQVLVKRKNKKANPSDLKKKHFKRCELYLSN